MTTLVERTRSIHDIAVAKGFWEADADHNFGEMIALAIRELAEALEEHREGRSAEWFQISGKRVYRVRDGSGADWTTDARGLTVNTLSTGEGTWTGVIAKPEGVVVELADCAMRCLDIAWWLADRHRGDLTEFEALHLFYALRSSPLPSNFGESITRITRTLCAAYDEQVVFADESALETMIYVVVLCEQLARSAYPGIDFWGVADRKIAYNATRPMKRGKRY